MTPDRWALAATSALLHQGGALHLTAVGLTVGSLATRPGPILGTLAVAALAAETVFAVRVGLDARLFDVAARLDPEDAAGAALDAGLVAAGLVPAPPPDRPWSARIAGARRLLRAQTSFCVAAAVVTAASAWRAW